MVVGLWGVYEGAKKDAGVQRAAGLSGRIMSLPGDSVDSEW